MVVTGEERTEGAINKATRQNLIVASTTFALCETSGEAASSRILLFVVTLQGHEISTRNSVFSGGDGGQQHRIVHAKHHSTIGLLSKLTSLNADGASIRQFDGFCNYVHRYK